MFRSAKSMDAESVEKVLAGNREAFEELVRRYERVVWGIALASLRDFHAAEDVVQEALLKAYKDLGSLRQPAHFGAWLVQITRNLLVDHARRASHRTTRPLEESDAGEQEDPGERELHRLLREQVLSLPPAFREAILLHYFSGKSGAELAPLLGISRAAAHKRIERGRQQLGRQLEAQVADAFHSKRRKDATHAAIMSAIVVAPLPVRAASTSIVAAPVAGIGAWKLAVAILCLAIPLVGWLNWREDSAEAVHAIKQQQRTIAAPDFAPKAVEADEAAPTVAAAEELPVLAASMSSGDVGVAISGTIRDTVGRKIAAAKIIAYSIDGFHAEGTSDAEGAYTLPWLGEREYTLRVRAAGYFPKSQTVLAPGRADFVLEQGGKLYCRLLDKSTQVPIADALMRLRNTEVRSDSNGYVTLVPEAAVYLNPSETVNFVARGYLRENIPHSELIIDSGNAREVYLERMTVITGEVVNQQGHAIPGVAVFSLEDGHEQVGTTDQSGKFTVEHLDFWPHSLHLYAFSLDRFDYEHIETILENVDALGGARIDLGPAQRTASQHHRVVMRGGSTLRVSVPRGQDQWWQAPQEGEFEVHAEVSAFPTHQEELYTRNNRGFSIKEASGDYYFPFLPPGEATISFSISSATAGKGCVIGNLCHLTVQKRVQLHAGGSESLDFLGERVRIFGTTQLGEPFTDSTLSYNAWAGEVMDMGMGSFQEGGDFEIRVLPGANVLINVSAYAAGGVTQRNITKRVEAPMTGEMRVDLS